MIIPIETEDKPLDLIPKDEVPDNDGLLETVAKSVVSGFHTVGAGIVGTGEEIFEHIIPVLDEGDNFLERMRENIQFSQKHFETTPDNAAEWVGKVLGQAFPIIGSAFAAGAWGGPLMAAAAGFAVEGQSAYDIAKSRGATETQANRDRMIIGGVNSAIEFLQIGKLLKFAKEGKGSLSAFKSAVTQKAWDRALSEGGKLTAKTLRNSVFEGITEAVQEGVGFAEPYIFDGTKSLPLKEDGTPDYGSIVEQIATAGLAGAVVSPFVALGKVGLNVASMPSDKAMSTLRQSILSSKTIPLDRKAVLVHELTRMGNYKQSAIDRSELPRGVTASKVREANKFVDTLEKFDAGILKLKDLATGKVIFKVKELIPSNPNALLTARETRLLLDHVKNSNYYAGNVAARSKTVKAMTDMFIRGKLPDAEQISLLEPVLGTKITRELGSTVESLKRKNLKLGQKIWANFIEAMNIPRALKACTDLSQTLRQGFFVNLRHPISIGLPAMKIAYRSFASPEYAEYADMEISTHPWFDIAKRSGLEKTEIGSAAKTEEYFPSKFAGRAPGVRASERAYVTPANYERHKLFYKTLEDWVGRGKLTIDDSGITGEYSGSLRDLASMINHLTGRGDIKALKKLSPALNIAFFSPALFQSNIQKVSDLFTKDAPVRKVLAGHLVSAVGTGITILMLAKELEKKYGKKKISVELDPRSTDFGKVVMGNTHVDFWAGYSQIARLVVQMASGEKKTTAAGKIIDVNRTAIAARFLQTKLSPVAGFLVDTARGENFQGNIIERTPEGLAKQGWNLVIPLFLDDVKSSIQYQGLGMESLLGGGLMLHGIGVQTYPESESTKLLHIKDQVAQKMFGSQWDELGPINQKLLRVEFPIIQDQEKRVMEENLHKPTSIRYIDDVKKTERTIVNNLPKEVRQELNALLVDVGGISRKISSDWYLNDKRYAEYLLNTQKELKEVLPDVLKLDLPPQFKRQFVEYIIASVKNKIRHQIVMSATLEDIERRRG